MKNYDGIKFYSVHDLSIGFYLEKLEKILINFDVRKNYVDINEIIELHNIKQYFDSGVRLNKWKDSDYDNYLEIVKGFNKIIACFFNALDDNNFPLYYDSVDSSYFSDFWALISHYKKHSSLSNEVFSETLGQCRIPINYVLYQKNIVNHFGAIISDVLMKNAEHAVLLLSPFMNNLRETEPKLHFPSELTLELKEELILNYIRLSDSNTNYLRLISQLKDSTELRLSDKTKLEAKRKYEQSNREFFSGNGGFTYGVEVAFSKEQSEEKIESYNEQERIHSMSYSENWIAENLDFPTLLNNFIYLFGYTDLMFRSQFPSLSTMEGAFIDILLSVRGKKDYNDRDILFQMKQNSFNLQMVGYYKVLSRAEVRLEEVFKWFYKEYLLNEFNAPGFIFRVPSESTTYLEKCKLLASEIDSVLKQFKIYVEDGHIDRELVEISSKSIPFENVPSFCQQKYIYPKSEELKNCMHMLFSSQSRLCYIHKTQTSYDNFVSALNKESLNTNDFEHFQTPKIDYLAEHGCIVIDEKGNLEVNVEKVWLLRDLYYNQVTCPSYLSSHKKLFSSLTEANDIFEESSLFTKPEQDYLSYILNDSKFNNGPALRNNYIHGSHSQLDHDHQRDYIEFLKVMVLIIIKINEEFCLRELLEQTAN